MPNTGIPAPTRAGYSGSEPGGTSSFQVWGILQRSWRLVMWFALGIPLAVMGVVETLPSMYTSKATLVLMQAQIPKQYVDQVASGSSAEMINGVTREVLSVTRLGGVVDRFGLFSKLRGVMTGEQLGEELRKRIEVRPVDQLNPKADYTAFSISYSDEDPRLAQRVLSQLATLFVEVNLQDREAKAQSTTAFLKGQLEISQKRLEEQERILMSARVTNASQNPTINAAKLSVQSDLRIQLQMNASNISRLQQQRASIRANMTAAIARVENERSALLVDYTEQHPEVRKKTTEIESIRKAMGGGGPTVTSDPLIIEMKSQLDRAGEEISNLESEAKALRTELTKYNRTILQSSPVSEQELTLAQKDYDLLRQEFADLQTKYFRSQVSANLEEEQSGQNFKLVDPPTLPSLPSSPKRLRISLVGLAVGLLFGIAAASREALRPTYATNKELATRYPSLLLINIPLMLTPAEERRKRIELIVQISLGFVLSVVMMLWAYRMYLNDTK